MPEQNPEVKTTAQDGLDQHTREMIDWHFSSETGTPFWIDFAKRHRIDPKADVQGFSELCRVFPNFEGNWLRFEPPERWTPRAYAGRPYQIFETGGTTGMPKQRLNWEDFKYDYSALSESLDDEFFPPGGNWLMMGPTGPRRLRLAIEYLANLRGSSCYFVDLDPRWVKKLIANGETAHAQAYMGHVVDQAVTILRYREIIALFTTPRLLEALSLKRSVPDAGVCGVLCGGTEMNPQTVRFLMEEVLENRTAFLPVYGNTLMGLAHSIPPTPENGYSVSYFAPQPRAVLRVVVPDESLRLVEYDEWGRVELTTMTREFFMPRFLERDEAIRRAPGTAYPWDGVAQVRPFQSATQTIVEGVY